MPSTCSFIFQLNHNEFEEERKSRIGLTIYCFDLWKNELVFSELLAVILIDFHSLLALIYHRSYVEHLLDH